MVVNCFQITEGLAIVPLAVAEALRGCQKSDARIWINLQVSDPEELEQWLDKLAVKNLSRRIFLEAGDRSGFYPLKREVLLVAPLLGDGAGEVDHVTFLCRENLLLTRHRAAALSLQRLADFEAAETWLPDRSTAGLLSSIMMNLSLTCLHQAVQLRDAITALEDRMDRDPDSVEADELLDMRSELLPVQSVVSDQLPSVQALSATDKPFFSLKDGHDYINCALANLEAANRSLILMDQRMATLRSAFQMYAGELTNRRLGMLTILSAIFMPITLLAGIWGMNFEHMPELKLPYGYPMALGIMALIGGGMFLFFRRNDWFG